MFIRVLTLSAALALTAGSALAQGEAPAINDGLSIRGNPPASAQPATDTIPLEIVHFNIRSEDCHPAGETQAEWNASLTEMEKKPACAAFEKERATLKAEYADNPLALEALTVRFGYGGPMNHRL